MSPEAATVATTDDPDLVVVSGELEHESCPSVRGKLLEVLAGRVAARADGDADPPALVVDLTDVPFASSAALAVLLELDARANAGGVAMVLVVPPGTFLGRLLDRTGLSETLPLAASAEAARRGPDRSGDEP